MICLDQYHGALVGLAVCDALGTTVEFRPPGTFQPLTDIVGGGPFHLEPGQWTDDTSLALCLAESLIEKQGFDPVDQLERYVRWHRHGHMSSTGKCFDIGGTTSAALAEFERTRKPYCGSTDPRRAGNGSIMRLAPVPLFFAGNPEEAFERSGDSSRTTHGARVCVDACRYLGALIAGAVNGAGKHEPDAVQEGESSAFQPRLNSGKRRPPARRRGQTTPPGVTGYPGSGSWRTTSASSPSSARPSPLRRP